MPASMMPLAWVRARKAKLIADYFGVSVQATSKRLQELGLIRHR